MVVLFGRCRDQLAIALGLEKPDLKDCLDKKRPGLKYEYSKPAEDKFLRLDAERFLVF